MLTEPFFLNDRVSPDGDNDEEEVIRLADAIDVAEGRTPPVRKAGNLDRADLNRRTVDYQRRRGLKPDGLVDPDGPTAQRIASDLYRRQEYASPSPQRRDLGRGANVPLHGAVGAGQSNLDPDVQAVRHALWLTGHRTHPARGLEGVSGAIRDLQVQQGLTVDGVITPFGPTHDLLDGLVAPRLQRLIGDDPRRPAAWAVPTPRMIARTMRFRPSTIRSREQDEETLPKEADWQAAVELGGAIAREMGDEAAWRQLERGADVIGDGAGDDALTGDSGGDAFRAAPAEGKLAPETESRQQAARERMEGAVSGLTEWQLDEFSRIAVEQGVDQDTDEQFRSYVLTLSADRPDHRVLLEEQLRIGKLTLQDLEAQVGSIARTAHEQSWNRELQRRFGASLDVLTDRYVEDARRNGIDLDRGEARARSRKLTESATSGGIDADTLGEMLLFALDFAPVVGEVKSAVEAVDLYRQMLDAEERGEDPGELGQAFLLAVAGAVPVLGKFAKGAKLAEAVNKVKLIGTGGQRHHRQMLKKLDRLKAVPDASTVPAPIDRVMNRLSQTTLGASLKEQVALRKWHKFVTREQKKGRPLSIGKFAQSNPHLAALSPSVRRSLQNTLNPLTGTQIETFIRGIMEPAKLSEFANGKQVHSLMYDVLGRPNSRILDATTEFDVVPAMAGLMRKRVKRKSDGALGLEFKGAASSYPKAQRDTDAVINSHGNSVVTARPDGQKKPGPNISEVALVRIAITEIPRNQYETAVVRKLVDKGYSEDVIAGVLGGIDVMYRLDGKLLENVTLATASAAALASAAVLAGELP